MESFLEKCWCFLYPKHFFSMYKLFFYFNRCHEARRLKLRGRRWNKFDLGRIKNRTTKTSLLVNAIPIYLLKKNKCLYYIYIVAARLQGNQKIWLGEFLHFQSWFPRSNRGHLSWGSFTGVGPKESQSREARTEGPMVKWKKDIYRREEEWNGRIEEVLK